MVGELHETRGQAGELLEAARVLSAGQALLYEVARLKHLQCDEAVECGECRLAQVGGHGLLPGAAAGVQVLDGGDELRADEPLASIKVSAGYIDDGPVEADVEGPLELLGVLPLKQGSGRLRRSLNPVSRLAVHRCPYCTRTFLPVAMSSMHSSRSPVSACSSCSSVSMPPMK